MPRSSRHVSIALVSEVAPFLRVEPGDVRRLIGAGLMPANESLEEKRSATRIKLSDLHAWLNGPYPGPYQPPGCWPVFEEFLHDFAAAAKPARTRALSHEPLPAIPAFAIEGEIRRFFCLKPPLNSLYALAAWGNLPKFRFGLKERYVTRIPLRGFHTWLQHSYCGWEPITTGHWTKRHERWLRANNPPRDPEPVEADFEKFAREFLARSAIDPKRG